jgi:peptide/nickel transport system substrate-binding protein
MVGRGLTLLAVGIVTAAASVPALAQAPKAGGTLTFAVTGDTPTYDCHATTTYGAIHVLAPHYSLLVKVDADKYPTVKPDLAESWTVTPDKKVFTFKLRKGVVFHNGSALTSRDIKATFDRMRNPQAGVLSVRKAVFEDIASIETPDAHTVVFTLKAPDPDFLDVVALPYNCVYSADVLEKDPRAPEKTVMGTGPFVFVEHVSGASWTGKKFDKYYAAGKPHLDGFKAFYIKASALSNALKGGQVMAEFRSVTPPERDQLKAAMGDKITIQETPWLCRMDLFFNAKAKPFDDPRVRKALQIAVDRWGGSVPLAKIATVGPIGGALRPGSELAMSPDDLSKLPGYSRNMEATRAEARKLLEDAGHKDLKIKLLNRNTNMPFTPVGVYVVDQWRRIGVTTEHQQLEVSLQKKNTQSGDYEAAVDTFCVDSDDPRPLLLQYLSRSRSPRNVAQNEAPEVDKLFDEMKAATDTAARKKIAAAIQTQVISTGYSVPLIWYSRIVAHSSAMKGWKAVPTHFVNQDLTDVWLDQ